MNTIVFVAAIILFVSVTATALYFVVRDHIANLKEYPMFKPNSSVLVNFAREMAGILAIGIAVNLLMVTVVITGTGSAIVGKIVKKANHTAYEAAYQSWKADQQWKAAADRRLAGARGADTTPIDALISVSAEKFAWEKANALQSNENAAFHSLDTFEAMESDVKAAEDRWMKRIQNW